MPAAEIELARNFNVSGFPTTMFLESNGDVIGAIPGYIPPEEFATWRGLLRDLERCRAEWDATGEITPFALGQRDAPDRFPIQQKLYGREAELSLRDLDDPKLPDVTWVVDGLLPVGALGLLLGDAAAAVPVRAEHQEVRAHGAEAREHA